MNNPYNPGGPPGQPSPYGYGPPPGGYGAPPAGGYGAPQANPYAPPGYAAPVMGYGAPGFGQVPFNPAQAAPEGTGAPLLKWFMLAAVVLPVIFSVIGGVISAIGDGNEDVQAAGGLVMMGGWCFAPIYFILIPIWVYQSWQMLPSAYRVTGSGKMVSPGQAVGFMFIPYFNVFYWNFIISMGYCDALNYLLQGLGSAKRAPRGLALAACICSIIPYVNILVAPLLWLIYAFMTDGAKKEFLQLSQNPAPAV
ncbi:MAG: hypothetical protein U0174_19070 [Polyangiaceae bacterium]